jgi:hypothetical protein
MNWGEALWWLPTAAVLAMSALALGAALARPPRAGRGAWVAAILICGVPAAALTLWQQASNRTLLHQETGRLRELGSRLDELGRLLPAGPGTTPGETFDTIAAAMLALRVRIEDLDEQIRALQEKARSRTIEPRIAAEVARYLRQFAPQRVVVSCVPDDVEAFGYANQIALMLRDGGWEALGPEKTAIFGDAPAMPVRFFARGAAVAPDAARILIEAFARFNIPYQSGVAPSDAIPDPATLELFVSRKS